MELENTYEHCDISNSECAFLIWLLFAALTSMLNQWLRLAVWLALLPRRVHACVFPFRICYNVYEYIYIFHFWTVSLTAHERFEWRTKRCRVVVPRIRLRVRPGWLFVVSPPLFAYKYMYNMAYIVYIYIYIVSVAVESTDMAMVTLTWMRQASDFSSGTSNQLNFSLRPFEIRH